MSPSFAGEGGLSVTEDSPAMTLAANDKRCTIVRPVRKSVKRIGSKSSCEVGAGLFSHRARGLAQAPLKVTRRVWTSDWNIARPSGWPVIGNPTPIEGSPELRPRVFGPAAGGLWFS